MSFSSSGVIIQQKTLIELNGKAGRTELMTLFNIVWVRVYLLYSYILYWYVRNPFVLWLQEAKQYESCKAIYLCYQQMNMAWRW